jgi:hypothetical protein
MTQLTQLATGLQQLLTTTANRLARATGAVRRRRHFDGAALAQTLVLGWLDNPQATLEELAGLAALCRADVSPQAVHQRFTPALATFFRELLHEAVGQVVTSDPAAVPLLRRFTEVYLNDSTVVSLPADCAAAYPATGGGNGQTPAALKLQLRLGLATGQLTDLLVEAGRASDRVSPVQQTPLPKGALRLADLGFFSLDALTAFSRQGVWWLSRLQAGTGLCTPDGRALDLPRLLATTPEAVLDRPVLLGSQHRLPARLLAVRCPPEVARQRLRRLKKSCQRWRRAPGRLQRLFCRWTVVVTSVPAALLSVREALVLLRARWQIELLIKLWKSHGGLEASRSADPVRRLVEVFAKLVGLVIQHWLLLVTVWRQPARSLRKAAALVRKYVYSLALALHGFGRLLGILRKMQAILHKRARIDKRKKDPSTCQLLDNPELLTYQGLT